MYYSPIPEELYLQLSFMDLRPNIVTDLDGLLEVKPEDANVAKLCIALDNRYFVGVVIARAYAYFVLPNQNALYAYSTIERDEPEMKEAYANVIPLVFLTSGVNGLRLCLP